MNLNVFYMHFNCSHGDRAEVDLEYTEVCVHKPVLITIKDQLIITILY